MFKFLKFYYLHFTTIFKSLLTNNRSKFHVYMLCSNKDETGRAHQQLISLAQTLVVNGKC